MTWQKLTVLHVLGGRATEKKQSVGGGDSVGSLYERGSLDSLDYQGTMHLVTGIDSEAR